MTHKKDKPTKVQCSVIQCESQSNVKGLCNKHYLQMYRHGEIRERTTRTPNEIVVDGDIAYIFIYNKHSVRIATAMVDADLADVIRHRKWRIDGPGYICGRNGKVTIKLHHVVAGKPPEGMVTDHINRDKLDNRRQNLRFVTRSQNAVNSNMRPDNTSGTTGIFLDKRDSVWFAVIAVNGKSIHLGRFRDKKNAIKARKEAEKKYHGKYAPDQQEPR